MDALLTLAAGGFAEGGGGGEAGVFGLVAVEELFDGEDLDSGILVAGQALGLVEASGDGFLDPARSRWSSARYRRRR